MALCTTMKVNMHKSTLALWNNVNVDMHKPTLALWNNVNVDMHKPTLALWNNAQTWISVTVNMHKPTLTLWSKVKIDCTNLHRLCETIWRLACTNLHLLCEPVRKLTAQICTCFVNQWDVGQLILFHYLSPLNLSHKACRLFSFSAVENRQHANLHLVLLCEIKWKFTRINIHLLCERERRAQFWNIVIGLVRFCSWIKLSSERKKRWWTSNLKLGWLLAFWNKMQTHERLKGTLV